MVKIDQNHRGGAMTGARSSDSNQINISINIDCVSEIWAKREHVANEGGLVEVHEGGEEGWLSQESG